MLYKAFQKGYQNTFDVKINHIEVEIPRTLEREIRILHLSDMHLEHLSITPTDLYEKVKDYKVDLIAITGDQIERKKNIDPFLKYIDELKKLNSPLGIYVTFGNHDYMMMDKNVKFFRSKLEQKGCIVLQNENHIIPFANTKLNIIGIDDFSTRRSNIHQAYSGIAEGVKLILTHDPNVVLKMQNTDFDYLLSGHFHGGQIHWPKPYHLQKMGKLARMKVIKGLHEIHGKQFYISEGLGQTGINIRAGSRPEITIHTIKGKSVQDLYSKAV